MPGPEPIWSPERHLDAVYRRGRQLRRRRYSVFASVPLLVIALVGVAVAGRATTSKPSVVTAAGRHAHETSDGGPNNGDGGASPGSSFHTRTQGHNDAATADGGNAGTGNQAAGPASLVPAPAVGPVGAPSVPSKENSPSDGSASPKTGAAPNTAAPTAVSTCSASNLQYTTHTDRSRYGSGQAVNITLVVTNRGSQPCNGPSPCGVGPWATVASAAGTVVWQSHPLASMCSNPPPVPHLAPGQSTTYGAGTWDQTICTSSGACSTAPSGNYTATAHRADLTAAASRFRIS
ncbi:MAG: hypothetical protein JO148_11120 [Acidimicrobiia bacterium]|nr:hypothetical protein [Acidimicrobiia bacterium]